jgi:hypothetical protein
MDMMYCNCLSFCCTRVAHQDIKNAKIFILASSNYLFYIIYILHNKVRKLYNAFNVHWTAFYARKWNIVMTFNVGVILVKVVAMTSILV